MNESKTAEFKNYKQLNSVVIAKCVCAFLNSETGGTITNGVTDKGVVLGKGFKKASQLDSQSTSFLAYINTVLISG